MFTEQAWFRLLTVLSGTYLERMGKDALGKDALGEKEVERGELWGYRRLLVGYSTSIQGGRAVCM